MIKEIPSAETIRRFTQPSGVKKETVEKNGISTAACNATPNSPSNVYSQWHDITPEMAARWLKNNFRNRPMAIDTIAAYARDMLNGTWRATHQGIAFNDQDQLIDGQHRLAAIVKANMTVRMMVTFGLESKIQGSEMTIMDCVDRGRPRSVADQLKIQHGLANGGIIASVCAVLAHLCFGERLRKLSVGQTLEIYRAFESSVDWVIAHRSRHGGIKSAGVLGAFAFVLHADDAFFSFGADVLKMLERLVSGEPAEKYPTIGELRKFLMGEQAAMIVASMNKGIAEMVVHAIDIELRGGNFSNSPDAWQLSVAHFHEPQVERVDKIAAMFKLPKIEKESSRQSPPAIREKLNSCDCGDKYPGKKYNGGCPKCRQIYSKYHNQTKSGVKPLRSSTDEMLAGDAV